MYGLRFRSTLVVVLLLAAVSCSRPSSPRPPADPAAQPREQERQVSTDPGIASADLYVLRSVGDVQLSPDGARIAFTVQNNDRAGELYTEIWTADVSGQPAKLPGVAQGSSPRWSPDGRRLAFIGRTPGGKAALVVADTEGTRVVNVAEIEQFYIALKDVGVETVMVRYPREGHSMRETRHIVDVIDRSIAWYERHFRGDPSRRGAK